MRLEGIAGSGVSGHARRPARAGARAAGADAASPRETLAEAVTVQFPGLAGVLPGFGRQEPNDWGLGLELRDGKSPHWTGARNSPRTFGHFGRSGTFLWVDPEAGLALACLTDLAFGDWAKDAWPRLADAVLAEARLSVPPSAEWLRWESSPAGATALVARQTLAMRWAIISTVPSCGA